uniref:Slc17a9 protein n=1 Tax=Fopius arisanus TaxID=64838 RepID=A0A0C9RKY1_9HYME
MDIKTSGETDRLTGVNMDAGSEEKNSFWSRRERKRWFISLLCGTCLLYATRTSVPLLMPVISKERKLSKADSGIILSSFFWGYTLTQVASGYISDRIGGQKIMWIAALGWSFTTFTLPNVIEEFSSGDHYVEIIAMARTITGAFQGMHFPSVISLTSQHLDESERASFFGLLTSGSALGTLLTGSLGSYLLVKFSWAVVFQVLGSLGLLWTLLLYYQTLNAQRRRTTSRNSRESSKSLPWRELWSKSPFWSCVFAHACQNNCFFVLLSWMPTYFHDTFPDVPVGLLLLLLLQISAFNLLHSLIFTCLLYLQDNFVINVINLVLNNNFV